jgi:hypothetical protein
VLEQFCPDLFFTAHLAFKPLRCCALLNRCSESNSLSRFRAPGKRNVAL